MSKMEEPLQFLPFSSAVETGFWHKLSQLKLDVLHLNEEPININGNYYNNAVQGLPALFNVDFTSFDSRPPEALSCPGVLINRNTRETFKECDKAELLRQRGEEVWSSITDGSALSRPGLLNRWLLITFADLKRYDFLYWFGFPALKCPSSVMTVEPPQPLSEAFAADQTERLLSLLPPGSPPAAAFLVQLEPALAVLPLARLTSAPAGRWLLAFCDPSADRRHPGWPLRNLLALYWHHCGRERPTVEVLCWRDMTRGGVRSVGHSLILKLRLPAEDGAADAAPAVTGWERNERGKMGPRMVNLSSTMDPKALAASSVDLNLKLMRWRLVPDLQLDKMTNARCLLLGAGTLGCNVARTLLGWGVRHITLVDNGTVSYSNPVRQSLFTFQDSVQRRPKAVAAAERLKDIFPGVISEGAQLSVPMPGHPVSAALLDQVTTTVSRLRQLVTDHDLVFLLMDSRESRWLPTVMGAAHQKVVITAALGYDSYLVMRHGSRPPGLPSPDSAVSCDPRQMIDGSELGCYFCNDVVAPGNSVQDRTLDQQCTVTRPGVSMIAAGLAVELAAALLQHPQRERAPVCPVSAEVAEAPAGPLGAVPHSVRGFLGQHQQLTPATRAFNRCTACSSKVLEQYREHGTEFLLKAFNQSSYLEDLTGLTELHRLTEAAELWELDDGDADDF
ncbi:ubiquitin-like modifier-activating enzyme ATG7 [Amphibalanus amphitrite]|uniref:ubiquitin-like modifier-activating enzyme ATG7 n=1 Tax=Amphibalanus amphitrite TaxID=1232801 RepID=UPI001C907698|nr:ubiquitin-like modifier-activating enzyme ATG7 [Amphibalanus amphitrite]XP_043220984.1 ubiquitin-like modifier-activating enzyme ATG7 [Amphibalanus amphitrite]XP_043220986.1 ubiquitin-like modifier-activating enzyme ATG7 [Amphibalanus amphitrite]XP_043220987.1 ubiquitin-like modifier-activating enzyme ATG7 [Amphibalanus amphitrite]XP_043220988.1 ubiquitin-like modifier-activating enzyme ATG7 [Amphibalanus amphitrite]XP_043220989.1 ubiquitin-like modifier-activating enzyme ATG7 [Amphibalanus